MRQIKHVPFDYLINNIAGADRPSRIIAAVIAGDHTCNCIIRLAERCNEFTADKRILLCYENNPSIDDAYAIDSCKGRALIRRMIDWH